jgi:DNA-binding XRE family transcriptional regulator
MHKPNVNLKMRLFELGIQQNELAKQIGISPGTFSAIVQGKSEPRVSTALKIAKALGVTVEYLWGEEDE